MTEKQFVEVENGEEVATICKEADSGAWVFICHGFGGNKDRQREYLKPLSDAGFNVVALDFRGNGDSDGDFIDQNLSLRIRDLEAVIDFYEPEETFLFGTSFGGKVVFHAAEENEVDGVIGKAPVTYSEIMDKFRAAVEEKGEFEYIEGKPIDRRFFDDFDSYSFDEAAERIECPVAIFHGADDTTVHPEYSFKAAEKLETDVALEKISGEKHSFSESGKDYLINRMISWLKTRS